jgi:hypothetical protein
MQPDEELPSLIVKTRMEAVSDPVASFGNPKVEQPIVGKLGPANPYQDHVPGGDHDSDKAFRPNDADIRKIHARHQGDEIKRSLFQDPREQATGHHLRPVLPFVLVGAGGAISQVSNEGERASESQIEGTCSGSSRRRTLVDEKPQWPRNAAHLRLRCGPQHSHPLLPSPNDATNRNKAKTDTPTHQRRLVLSEPLDF